MPCLIRSLQSSWTTTNDQNNNYLFTARLWLTLNIVLFWNGLLHHRLMSDNSWKVITFINGTSLVTITKSIQLLYSYARPKQCPIILHNRNLYFFASVCQSFRFTNYCTILDISACQIPLLCSMLNYILTHKGIFCLTVHDRLFILYAAVGFLHQNSQIRQNSDGRNSSLYLERLYYSLWKKLKVK